MVFRPLKKEQDDHDSYELRKADESCKKALGFQYRVPIREKVDPIAFLPKEADYHEDDELKSLAANQYNEPGKFLALVKGACRHLCRCASSDAEDYKRKLYNKADYELELASRFMRDKPDSIKQVNILCAKGEAYLMQGSYSGARNQYIDALPVLENSAGEGNQRRAADINAKIGICYEAQNERQLARRSYAKALRIYKALLRQLSDEAESSATTVPKESEKDKLNKIIGILRDKYGQLREPRQNPEPSAPNPALQ
ncbi:hypothetical protein Tsubulata_016657 [Turnera subulata]|uniref:Tetratricopeptide repeat protein n=1 Tax=Turnera subulata TaxID=218843 RepID=A0A9Q0FP88_9ROSI|nr:hypothetical protein Tsubulata_016657 [Turnera subulata]